jgi:hypothetical protein
MKGFKFGCLMKEKGAVDNRSPFYIFPIKEQLKIAQLQQNGSHPRF